MMVFPHLGKLKIERPKKYGGDITLYSFEELAKIYFSGDLHPLDLKKGLADAVVNLLKPVRDYFDKHPENLEKIKSLNVTR